MEAIYSLMSCDDRMNIHSSKCWPKFIGGSLSLSLFSTSSNNKEEEGKDFKLKLGVDTVGGSTLGLLIHRCPETKLGAKRRRQSLEHKGEDINQL